MTFADASTWQTREYEQCQLNAVLTNERRHACMLQRTVAEGSGISQPQLSDYERNRVVPGWNVFVRILETMGRRPVIRTEPLEPAEPAAVVFEAAIEELLRVVDRRRYRLENAAAACVLGGDRSADHVHASVQGDPSRLDELAEVAARHRHTVTTVRGTDVMPHVQFNYAGVLVLLEVVTQPRRSIDVSYGGLRVQVAPIGDLRALPKHCSGS